MSELAQLLTRELEELREEDRRREERLSALVSALSVRQSDLTEQLERQAKRDEAVTQLLVSFRTRMEDFERRLTELLKSSGRR